MVLRKVEWKREMKHLLNQRRIPSKPTIPRPDPALGHWVGGLISHLLNGQVLQSQEVAGRLENMEEEVRHFSQLRRRLCRSLMCSIFRLQPKTPVTTSRDCHYKVLQKIHTTRFSRDDCACRYCCLPTHFVIPSASIRNSSSPLLQMYTIFCRSLLK